MAAVLHAGRTVITNAEGGWVYTPASKPARNMHPVVLARITRAKLKRLASQPVAHSLSVDFVGDQAAVAGFRARISGLYNGVVGSLSVPGHDAVPSCAFTGVPSWTEQKRVADGYLYTVTLEITEL